MPLNNQLSTDRAGLHNTKPKTTWTQFNRMEFGLGGLARAITLPTLGKRDMSYAIGEQVDENENKRGKVVNEEGFSKDLSRRGWTATLAGSNETVKLKLPRAWEPLDRS